MSLARKELWFHGSSVPPTCIPQLPIQTLMLGGIATSNHASYLTENATELD